MAGARRAGLAACPFMPVLAALGDRLLRPLGMRAAGLSRHRQHRHANAISRSVPTRSATFNLLILLNIFLARRCVDLRR